MGKNVVARLESRRACQTQTDAFLLEGFLQHSSVDRAAETLTPTKMGPQTADAEIAEAIEADRFRQAGSTANGRDISIGPTTRMPCKSALRPSTAVSLGRLYPSSLSAGIAASSSYASLTKSGTSAPSRPMTSQSCSPPLPSRSQEGLYRDAKSYSVARGESQTLLHRHKPRFHGPLPMVRLVQGFSQSGVPHKLHCADSQLNLERQRQLLDLPPSNRWLPDPEPDEPTAPRLADDLAPCKSDIK